MGSRGGQSLISTEFHVLTIRGIQVDGRCEIGERGRLAHELLTTRTTTRLETRNKREHFDCETKRGNLDTRAAPAILLFYFSLQLLHSSLLSSHSTATPVSSDRGIRGTGRESKTRYPRFLEWKSRCTRSNRRRFALFLSSSYFFAPPVHV